MCYSWCSLRLDFEVPIFYFREWIQSTMSPFPFLDCLSATLAAFVTIITSVHLGHSSALINDVFPGNTWNSRGVFHRHNMRKYDVKSLRLHNSPIDHSYMAFDLYESSSSGLSSVSRKSSSTPRKVYNHTMAILTFPSTFEIPPFLCNYFYTLIRLRF